MERKRCFVIMPIGKEGTRDYAHFRSVFEVVIKPGVEEAGYQVWRADESMFTGSITKEVVEALASSDLVIADLTDRNPNVYLELGIRHCLRRSGTIHLIRADQALPFDVAGYRAIKYSTEFDKIDAVRTAITNAILEKDRAPELPDNPVHDTLDLPHNYRSLAANEQVREMQVLEQRLAAVTRENEGLRKRYQTTDTTGGLEVLSPELLDERELAVKLTGIATQIRENALPVQLVVRAQQAAAEGDVTELVTAAQKLLLNPYTSGTEYGVLAQITRQAGLEELHLLILEQAAAKFPGDAHRGTLFAEACIHTSDPATQDRGKRLLETHLGIVWENDEPKFAKGPQPDGGDGQVAVLLDFYHSNDRVAEESAVALAALDVYGETAIILRNVARAYEDAQKGTLAIAYYERALEADPTSDTTLAWFGSFHARRKDFPAARMLHARACLADDTDARLALALLGVYLMQTDASPKKDNNRHTIVESLGALAIGTANGSIAIRSQVAQRFNVAGYSAAANRCLDGEWPTQIEVMGGRALVEEWAVDAPAVPSG